VEIISHCVWLYHRFPLSLREAQEMMAERGVIVSHESIRAWSQKFGQAYANGLRRHRPRPADKWHLDEVFIKVNGQRHYLWRAVDQHGNVLDILVTSQRNAKAATRFFRKLFKGLRYVPRVLVTDKLASYGVAHRRLMPGVEHRRSKYLNNRAENSHQPTRQRERAMNGFTSAGHAQRVPLGVQRDITALPAPPPPPHRGCLPTRNDHPLRHLEQGRWPAHGCLTGAGKQPAARLSHTTSPSTPNNLTTPSWRCIEFSSPTGCDHGVCRTDASLFII
jgi:putative transposase